MALGGVEMGKAKESEQENVNGTHKASGLIWACTAKDDAIGNNTVHVATLLVNSDIIAPIPQINKSKKKIMPIG